MAVNKGYKQTEVGLIPDDWDVVALGRMIRSVEYGSSSKSFPIGAIPVIRMGNLQNGKIDWDDLAYTDNEQEIKRYLLRQGDVLFNRTNTIDLVGKSAIYDGQQPAIFAGYLIRINALPGVLDTRYLNYILNTELSRKHSAKVLSIAVGQANINGQKLKTYPIPLPPTLAEQEAIAGALSDADAWIESLEQLIAKKRQIKQGAMQELLTGKRRLPGFEVKRRYKQTEVGVIPEDWELKRLGDFVKITSGQSPSTLCFSDLGIPYFKVEQLNNSEKYLCARDTPYTVKGCGSAQAHSVIFAKRGGAIALNKIRILKQASFMDTNLMALTSASGLIVEYLFYSLSYIGLWQFADTTSVPQINNKHIKPLPIPLPPTLTEQQAIATVLSDMDTEIESLESKLAKVREIKQGMMQELLTGRIRLV